MHPINYQRGEEALRGLRAYKGTWFAKVNDDADEMNSAIADLICDLRHLADRYSELDWFQITERAERDYNAEDDDNPDDIEAATREEFEVPHA